MGGVVGGVIGSERLLIVGLDSALLLSVMPASLATLVLLDELAETGVTALVRFECCVEKRLWWPPKPREIPPNVVEIDEGALTRLKATDADAGLSTDME